MRKYIQNIWVRLLACLLCTVSVLGVALSAAGTLFFIENPDKEKYLEEGNQQIMLSYALYATDYWKSLEKDNILQDTNLYMRVEKVEYLAQTPEEPVITHLFSNMPEGMTPTYVVENIYSASQKYYGINSLAQALNAYYHSSSMDHMEKIAIDGYVFDVHDGLFYYHTARGFFKADYVYVSENGVSYDYRLTVKNGKEIYYNGYYDKKLNTDDYLKWDWVQLSVKKMGITSDYYDAMIQLVGDSSIIQQELCKMNFYVDYYHIYYVSDVVPYYQVSMALAEPMTKQDLFVEYDNWVNTIYGCQNMVPVISICSLISLLVGVVLLAISAPEEKEKLRFFHRMPLLLFTGIGAAVEVGLLLMITLFIEVVGNRYGWEVSLVSFLWPIIIVAEVMVFLVFVYLANLMTRIRTKVFFRYTILYYISRPLVAVWKSAKENLSLFWKGAVILTGISLVEFLLFCFNQHEPDNLFVLFVLGKLIVILLVAVILVQMQKLREGTKRVASGEVNSQISTTGMFGVFKDHAEDINRVSDGIAIAVEDQMKSERFKTELITNVSHDIKTPLTSIINYVDLIKKEDLTDPTMLEYVDVLDRQSARLKKLIEDLMEASKASTGNLEVNLEECDMGVLLTQVVGEFEDKLSSNGLEVVVNKPEEPVLIMADGRHIWRVLDNLMNNVCKYSQEKTRVYVSLEKIGKEAHITFKNISKTALNIPSDQLMQRFVRGDSSRHTEGSGLGLSIAQSLTELMKGQMQLDIDGDLFKVTLKFDITA